MKKHLLLFFAIFSTIVLFLNADNGLSRNGRNETPKNVNDERADRFAKCCKDKGIPCSEVCTYPPPDFSLSELWCMFKWNNEFTECYTGGKNNTNCCVEHGVVGVYSICQDYCDGSTSHGYDPRYSVCGPVKKIISKCNHDALPEF